MKCPACGKNFHHCSSCSTTYMWECKYCSRNCFRNSNEYEIIKRAFESMNLDIETMVFIYENEEIIQDILNI